MKNPTTKLSLILKPVIVLSMLLDTFKSADHI